MNAGKMGRMQGEKNEPAPASADTSTFTSTTIIIFVHKCINSFIQISSRLTQNLRTGTRTMSDILVSADIHYTVKIVRKWIAVESPNVILTPLGLRFRRADTVVLIITLWASRSFCLRSRYSVVIVKDIICNRFGFISIYKEF